ncbi:flagellar protein MotY [Gayadomonas joobiniege]|uniref:flagellar protein MotY n=1 Tax=Gayadomonas joobiniege TaxID=1234606 RepID=UPI000378DDE8|nr:OmpA family protein [Gayadomonas joobiniege]
MKYSGTILSLVILVSLLTKAHGQLRQYHAELANSTWQVAQNKRLSCNLAHPIPGYGEARFSSTANKKINMTFTLDMLNRPQNYSAAEVLSVPPPHRAGQVSRKMSQMQLLSHFDGELTDKAAWLLITELEKGMMPTFYYDDWLNNSDQVAVGLNSANFHGAYQEFLNCRDQLLNYTFDDIAMSVLTYQSNTAKLTAASKKRLHMIAEYLKQDNELELVLIQGYSDSYGGRWHNEQLSKERAKMVKDFFLQNGLDASRISAQGHGEKRHVASNQNLIGRSKNRRVVVQMERTQTLD